ncbi:MAG TPA: hypothetical protein VNO33_08900 [Kofleriaceae bacterium]|nr:hypothetical protein [Kofleriaceae bacterium]
MTRAGQPAGAPCRILSACAVALAILLAPHAARADLLELTWATSGFYRSRALALTNLARQDQQTFVHPPTGETIVVPEIRRTSYIAHRLRLVPELRYGDRARLTVQVDALDDVLWGDNSGVSAAPLVSSEPSNQGFLGGSEQPSIEVKRAWIELGGELARLRAGRMPSHWGMGLLDNGGGSGHLDREPGRPPEVAPRLALDHYFDDDFGDNHFGSTADRVMLAVRPLSIVKAARGRKQRQSSLSIGYGYGVVTEAPLYAAEPFERRFRPFGQQGFLSRGVRDDLDEHVAFALWDDPYWQPGGWLSRDTDELRLGFYGVMRRGEEGSTSPSALDPGAVCGELDGEAVACRDSGTRVWIADVWYRVRYGPFYSEAEGMRVGGTTFGGLPFPTPNRKKELDIDGGVARIGFVTRDPAFDPLRQLVGIEPYERDLWAIEMEAGHAAGDRRPDDARVKQRALHPDFNAGLILFEEILRELSARTYGPPFASLERPDGVVEMFSQGGVVNSNYLFPKLRYHLPLGDTTLVVGLLMAWVDTLAESGTTGGMFTADQTGSDYLGTELDGALKAMFHEHVELSIESGYLWYGDALRSALPNAESSFTLQSRLSFVW